MIEKGKDIIDNTDKRTKQKQIDVQGQDVSSTATSSISNDSLNNSLTSKERGFTDQEIASIIEIKNLDGTTFNISPELLIKMLPSDSAFIGSPIQALRIDKIGYLIEQGESVTFLTHDGLIYRNNPHASPKDFDKNAQFTTDGQLCSSDGSSLSPRARLLSVGDGKIALAPPNIELVDSKPNLASKIIFGILTKAIGDSWYDPVVAKCTVKMVEPLILGYSGPGPCGDCATGAHLDDVKWTVRKSGATNTNAELGEDGDSRCFPWEQSLATCYTESYKLFDRLMAKNR